MEKALLQPLEICWVRVKKVNSAKYWAISYICKGHSNYLKTECIINPSTHRVHKTWTFLIIIHNSWYRSRKIKEDSSTERFEPIFITVQCTSRSQDFSNEKWSRNLQIGNAFNDWNSTISHANWQCLTKKSYIFFIVMHYTSFGSAIKRN